MLVFAVILLIFANHQSPVGPVRRPPAREPRETGGYLPVFASRCSWPVRRLRLRHRRHLRRGDARRRAARRRAASCRAIWLSGIVGAVFLLAIILATPDMTRRADRIRRRSRPRSSPGLRRHARQRLPVRHPRRGLRLHAGDPGRHDAPHVLDGPRPAGCRSDALGPRQPNVPDPGQRGRRRRRPRRPAVPHHRQPGSARRRAPRG